MGWLLAFAGLIIGYIWVMHYIFKLDKPIKELIKASNNKLNPDSGADAPPPVN